MAKPAFMRGKGSSLFGDKKDETPEAPKASGAKSHLDALSEMADSPRAQAAIKTLRVELLGSDNSKKSGGKEKSATKSAAMERFAAS